MQWPEFKPSLEGDDTTANPAAAHPPVHHSLSHSCGPKRALSIPTVRGNNVTNDNSTLVTSFNGLNHRDQRLANGGNQFSLEPPDQGLCVGNGFIFETVNDAIRVYNNKGAPLTGVIAINQFLGYPPEIVRSNPPVFGPEPTDPSCYYDPDTQRWFFVVLTLEVAPKTGALTLDNHLDIAVSTTASPLGSWVLYKLPVQNDGTQGTPKHAHCPCVGDYPHIGADKYGFYIANASIMTVVQFENLQAAGLPGFTVWPAIAPNSLYALNNHGTEFFLSSTAADEVTCPTGCIGPRSSDNIVLWALSNTASLDSTKPALVLSNHIIHTITYAVPPLSDQKAGDFPLGQCINDTTMPTPFGPGCWQFIFVTEPHHIEVEGPLDSNDTRMQQVYYADGKVWGALDTAVNIHGQTRAGIAYFVIRPDLMHSGAVTGQVAAQGYVAVANNNVIYPAMAVLPNGHGVMAFTLVGQDYYPSAGYIHVEAANRLGDVHVAAAGLGPQDGFTEYKAFRNPPRPRWGDYGAAVTDGNSIWIASEYIAQTCTLAQYANLAAFGSCSGSRTALANWGTRISQVNP